MRRLLLALAACVLAGCATRPTDAEIQSADYGAYPSAYEEIIRSHMQRVLKDPESARYAFLNSPKTAWSRFAGKKFGYAVCANINARNSFGGYVGNRMSYFLIRDGRVIDESHGDGNYGEAIVQGRCEPFV